MSQRNNASRTKFAATVVGTVLLTACALVITARPGRSQEALAGQQHQDDCNLSHYCGVPYRYIPPSAPPNPSQGRNWRSGGGVKLENGTAVQTGGTPGWGTVCFGSPICGWRANPNDTHIQHEQTLGLKATYPLRFPEGAADGGVTGLAMNSKGHVYAFVRNAPGKPQLFEWNENHKFIRSFGIDLTGKSHGMAIDADDNLWVTDQFGDTVIKLDPQGRVLLTLGVKGKRGDWNEAKGERLLWQPMDLAFAPDGDIYISMGHGNESPNDGAARVLHLAKNGKFLNQWFGNSNGPGKFSMAHGIAVDPKTGNVYIADREEYRIVVYDANGKFIRTIQEPNLVCALYFDPHGQLWMSTGMDGQIVKLDVDGKIVGAAGNGPGRADGQFVESNYMAMDRYGDIYVGDTSVPRVTEFTVSAR